MFQRNELPVGKPGQSILVPACPEIGMGFPAKLIFCSAELKDKAALPTPRGGDLGFQHGTWCEVGLMRPDYTLVHILIPDMSMLFPGDPGCNMKFFS